MLAGAAPGHSCAHPLQLSHIDSAEFVHEDDTTQVITAAHRQGTRKRLAGRRAGALAAVWPMLAGKASPGAAQQLNNGSGVAVKTAFTTKQGGLRFDSVLRCETTAPSGTSWSSKHAARGKPAHIRCW